MINVKRPQKGQRTLQSIFDSVNSIIDYLPTLTVRGDNYSTYVEHSTAGTIVHAKQSTSPDQTGTGGKYYAGSGIAITSGNFINAMLSAGPNINIDYNNGYFVISGTPAGSGTTPTPGGVTYVGDGDLGSGHIFVDNAATPNPVICSNLYWISDLNNLPFVESSNIVMPNSLTACNNTVDISQVGQIYSNHFLQTRDILYDGVGTKVSLAWMRNPFGDQSEEGTNGIVQGLQVDLTLSGGRYTDVILHKHVYGAYDPDSGTRYDPPTESRVDCLLTGTYDHYPHTSGFIDVVPVEMEDGKTWGVISTNLHAGSGITIDPQTGEISCDGGGGGTTIIASGLQYPNYMSLYNDDNGNVSGLGISFLLPVSAGQTYKYYTDARNEVEPEEEGGQTTYQEFAFATYAPAEGKTGDSRRAVYNGVDFVPSADGWVRISVFDDGTHEGSCLRFYEGENTTSQYATPLYRFHGFEKYTEGAGIAIDSGIISCMIQTDRNDTLSGITSAALLTPGQYPTMTGIAIGLSTQFAEDLFAISGRLSATTNEDRILSSHNGTLSWEENNSTQTTWSSLTPSLLSVDNNNHTLSAATQSGGGGGSGMPWPNYANLDNSTGNAIMLRTRYQAGSAGGWLRISYKGSMTDDCYYVKIGPDGNNDAQIGLWRVQTGQGYYGQVGNTWLLPVPPDNYFYVSFPNSVATAWFDASVSQDSPQPIPPSAYNYPVDIEHNYGVVVDCCNEAQYYKNEAEGYESRIEDASDYYQADEYASEAESNADWAEDSATSANEYATESETKNAALISYGVTSSTEKTQQTRSKATEAQTYATQARQAATRARAAANAFPHQ